MSVRMKDIAEDLHLSVITISKVLRNHPDIAAKTRERVLKRVKELDYQPNILARSLVTGKSYLIGLVVPGLMHPFFAEIAMSLSAIAGKRGYSLIISSSEQNPKLEAIEIRHLLARRLDALVVAASGDEIEVFKEMERLGQPYVLVDQELPGLSANFVGVDDEAMGRIATEHLIDQGCKVIAHIRSRKNITGIRRFEGYKQALLHHGLEYRDALVVARSKTDIDGIAQGAEAMRLLLKQHPRPDGVFCYNDPLAIGAMDVIAEAGLRIPQDVAVIGCGNLYYNQSLRVPLSSMDQHSRLIGEKAAGILHDLLESKERPQPKSVILNPTLVMRASTMRKPQPATRATRSEPKTKLKTRAVRGGVKKTPRTKTA
jgi:LacI family transcriptional regulator